jgi:hypothetical protein
MVVFNKVVDSTTATTYTNYSVKGSAGTELITSAAKFALSADSMSVTITLDPATPAIKLANPDSATVKVTGVKDARGVAMADYAITAVAVSDSTLPTVTAVAQIGPNQFKVSYSKPILASTTADYVVDGGAYYVSGAALSSSGTSVTVTVGTTLAVGSHIVKINPGSANLADAAGYKVLENSQTFTAATDATIPTVTVTGTQTSVKFVFSKAVKNFNLGTVGQGYDVAAYQVVPALDATTSFVGADGSTYATTWTANFSAKPLSPGNVTIFLDNNASSTNAIADIWGNKVANSTFIVNVVNDVTAPTVASASIDVDTATGTFHQLTVVYSKNVVGANTSTNYVLQGSDATVYTLTAGAYDPTTYTEVYTVNGGTKIAAGPYTLTISSITDTTPNANKLATYIKVIPVADSILPVVSSTITKQWLIQEMLQFYH